MPPGVLRALLILLALSLSLPIATPTMAASCHDMAMTTQDMPTREHHAPAPANHLCIGCIPPADWLRARIDPPAPRREIPAVITIATLDRVDASPPALPPPRRK